MQKMGSVFASNVVNGSCRNAKELHCVGLHWRVPFIEVLSETVQVVW